MKRNALLSTLFVTSLSTGFSLCTTVLLARNLGAEGRGELLALTFWPGLLSGLLSLSINEGTSYWVARTESHRGQIIAKTYIASALALQIFVAIFASLLTISVLPLILPAAQRPYLLQVVLYAAIFMPLATLNMHFKAVLQGQGDFNRLNIVNVVQPVGYLTILLTLLLTKTLRVETVMAAMVAPVAVSVLVGLISVGGSLKGVSRLAVDQTLGSSWKFHQANIILYAAAEADKLIVLYIMDNTNIGLYAVAIAVSSLGSNLVIQSLSPILYREMTAKVTLLEQGHTFIWYLNISIFLLLLVNGVAALSSRWWLPMLFGVQFKTASSVAAVLLLMGAIRGLRGIIDRSMRALHDTRVGMIGESVGLIATIVCGSIGANIADLIGVAWGLLIAQLISLIAMLSMASQVIPIDARKISPLHPVNIERFRSALRRLEFVKRAERP